MRLLWIIVALLIVVPIVEIAVLIAIGQVIGIGWTLLLMLVTSAIGGWLLRREGSRAWRAFQEALAAGRPPGREASDGVLVLMGGMFMLVPGFASDVIGLLLLLPPTRAMVRPMLLNAAASRLAPDLVDQVIGPRKVRARRSRSGATGAGPDPTAGTTPWSEPTSGTTPGPAIEGEVLGPDDKRAPDQ